MSIQRPIQPALIKPVQYLPSIQLSLNCSFKYAFVTTFDSQENDEEDLQAVSFAIYVIKSCQCLLRFLSHASEEAKYY